MHHETALLATIAIGLRARGSTAEHADVSVEAMRRFVDAVETHTRDPEPVG